MRKSQRNNSALSRFVYYKWSGPIVLFPMVIIGISLYLYIDYNQEFFTAWSCETIQDYLLNKDVPEGIPLHNEITDQQHLRLHGIVDECNNAAKFSEKIGH